MDGWMDGWMDGLMDGWINRHGVPVITLLLNGDKTNCAYEVLQILNTADCI
jgi:hypothetical protein